MKNRRGEWRKLRFCKEKLDFLLFKKTPKKIENCMLFCKKYMNICYDQHVIFLSC